MSTLSDEEIKRIWFTECIRQWQLFGNMWSVFGSFCQQTGLEYDFNTTLKDVVRVLGTPVYLKTGARAWMCQHYKTITDKLWDEKVTVEQAVDLLCQVVPSREKKTHLPIKKREQLTLAGATRVLSFLGRQRDDTNWKMIKGVRSKKGIVV
jgi:hypothetical protein